MIDRWTDGQINRKKLIPNAKYCKNDILSFQGWYSKTTKKRNSSFAIPMIPKITNDRPEYILPPLGWNQSSSGQYQVKYSHITFVI